MYEVHFYKRKDGSSQVEEYITALSTKNDKDSRIKFNKILDYLSLLEANGLALGEPYIKHIEGELWELRPLRDRFFFARWDGCSFVILHQFVKKTQKTPHHELEQARRELADWKERSES